MSYLEAAAEVAMTFNVVELVTPVGDDKGRSLQEVREAWKKDAGEGVFWSPMFRYDTDKLATVAKWLHEGLFNKALEELDNLIQRYERSTRVQDTLLMLARKRLITAISTCKIADAMLRGDYALAGTELRFKYGLVDPALVITARKVAEGSLELMPGVDSRFSKEEREKLKTMEFNAEGIKFWFERALELYGVEGWEVRIGPEFSSIDVREKNSDGVPYIAIPESRVVDGLKLLELIGHEIGCHLIDGENCRALMHEQISEAAIPELLPLASLMAKSDDETLSEGHAKLSDISVTGRSGIAGPWYILAESYAVEGGGFAAVGSTIARIKKEMGSSSDEVAGKEAWMPTFRSLRGMTDTAANGEAKYCMTKDQAYFAGMLKAAELEKTQPMLLRFSNMESGELELLQEAGVALRPKYPQLDIVGLIYKELVA